MTTNALEQSRVQAKSPCMVRMIVLLKALNMRINALMAIMSKEDERIEAKPLARRGPMNNYEDTDD